MPSINWLIDEALSERQYDTGFPTLAEAVRLAGHEAIVTKYRPFSTKPLVIAPPGTCVVTHGTIQFCKQIEKQFGRLWTPAMYFNANVKSFNRYAVHIADDLLNWDYYILPWGEIVSRKLNDVFVKPLSGLKEFVGQVIINNDYDIQPQSPIDPETPCVISSAREIRAEFRYVIADRKVVTGCEYRWGDVLDVRIDTHPLCDALAEKIASAGWQADTVYVCDIALIRMMSTEIARVIELNAFSSSGLYACDTRKIVEAVSAAAIREHSGEVDA